MEKQIQTTGDLRKFLSETMVGVAEGKVKLDRAAGITKLAAQINESMKAEIRYQQVTHDLGRTAGDFGKVVLIAEAT